MKLHEYQAKQILRKHGVPVLDGRAVFSPNEISKAYKELKTKIAVIKAQIHAGGRGKGTIYDGADSKTSKKILGGGVKIAESLEKAQEYGEAMLGNYLQTIQTGPMGRKVSCIYIEKGTDIKKEFYLSLLLDRRLRKPIFVSSQAGGMEIEETAAKEPEKIHKLSIDPSLGLQPWQARAILFSLGITKENIKQGLLFLNRIWDTYIKEDISLLEINPLVLNGRDELIALDCKMDLDDNALFRHEKNALMRDTGEEDPLEVQASEHNLNYIRLAGNVGCMVNGAGLAMATMDLIKLAGAEPANFLDVGGGANAETVSNGFRIILEDPNVKAVFVNIFGGIVQCDRVASGIVEAAKKINIKVPLVVRLQGTNAPQARKILEQSGLDILAAETLQEGTQKISKALSAL